MGTAATGLLIADNLGMFKGYNPKGIEKVKKGMKDAKNNPAHWVGIKAWATGIVGKTMEMEGKGFRCPLLMPIFSSRYIRASSSCPTRPLRVPAF